MIKGGLECPECWEEVPGKMHCQGKYCEWLVCERCNLDISREGNYKKRETAS